MGVNLISCSYGYDKIYIYDGVSDVVLSQFDSPSSQPDGIVYDTSTGNLISCDSLIGRIYVHDGVSSTILSQFDSPASSPYDITYDTSTGNLISCDYDGRIYVHDGVSSNILTSFNGPNGAISAPAPNVYSITYDTSTGNLISCDYAIGKIYIHAGVHSGILSSFDTFSDYPTNILYDGSTGNLISMMYGSPVARIHDGVSSAIIGSLNLGNYLTGLAYAENDYTTYGHTSPIADGESWSTYDHTSPAISGKTAQAYSHSSPLLSAKVADAYSHSDVFISGERIVTVYEHANPLVNGAWSIAYNHTAPSISGIIARVCNHASPSMSGAIASLYSHITAQLRGDGQKSYLVDIRDADDYSLSSKTFYPPQTSFTDVFTGVPDGKYTLYVRAVEKFKNLENTITETYMPFSIVDGLLQLPYPNEIVNLVSTVLADGDVKLEWYYDDAQQEIAPDSFSIYIDDVYSHSVDYNNAGGYSYTMTNQAEVLTSYKVTAKTGTQETDGLTVQAMPDSTPPVNVPITFEVS